MLHILLFFFSLPSLELQQAVNPSLIYVQPKYKSEFAIKDYTEQLNALGYDVSLQNSPVSNGVNFIYEQTIPEYSFGINSNESVIEICYSDHQGFINGLYYLLGKWGFHFLGYSDNWIERPHQIKPFYESELHTPDIAVMKYGGTGGNGWNEVQKELVKKHQIRNSLNLSGAGGHGYRLFYKNFKKEIDSYHKDGIKIFNDSQKKKNINIDSPETISLVKKWFEKEYLAKKKKEQKVNLVISPGDMTSGQGENSSNPLVKNTITKWLWLGNEVAKYLNEKYNDPDLTFGYYAYGNGKGQLLPPSLPLESNIIIQVIPYAFQDDYKDNLIETADIQALKAWKKAYPDNTLQVYDYWNISQWSKMLPKDNLFEEINKMDIWKEYNVQGVTLESTFNSAVMNPHLWVASQYAKNFEKKTIDELYDEYFSLAFADSAEDLRELYELFSNWDNISFCHARYIIENAYKNTKDEVVKKRIVELMAYLNFVSLNYRARNLYTDEGQNSSAYMEWQNAALEYERYAKKINSLGIVQTWAAWKYNYAKNKPWSGKSNKESWQSNLSSEGYKALEPQILRQFYENTACNEVIEILDNQIQINSFEAIENTKDIIKPFQNRVKFKFIANKTGELKASIVGSNESTILEFLGSNGQHVIFKNNPKDFKISLPIEKGVEYQGLILGEKLFGEIHFENTNQLIFYESLTQKNGYEKNSFYFYVPIDAKKIVFSGLADKRYKTTLIKPSGKEFAVDEYQFLFKNPNVSTFSVPTYDNSFDGRGKVWKIKSYSPNVSIKNFNTVLSRKKFSKRH